MAEAVKQLKKETAAGERVEEVSYRLTDARRKRLEDVGFVWSAREGEKGSETGGRITRNSYDDQWDTMFEKLKEYKEKHGVSVIVASWSFGFGLNAVGAHLSIFTFDISGLSCA